MAPAAPKAVPSSPVIPPSGPTTTSRSPDSGRLRRPRLAAAPGSSTIAHAAFPISSATWPTEASGVTSGIQARRDCFAASRAVSRHLASERSPRAPCHTGTQRAAAHGTMRSTPTSVISSTASSPRSPFGMAWTTVIAGSGYGTCRLACTVSSRPPVPPRDGPATTHSATRPAPSATSARSPGRSLRTAACRPSAPDRTTMSDSSAARSARNTGGCTVLSRGCLASGASRQAGSAAVERVAQPGEEPLGARREPARGRFLAAQLGQVPQQLLLLGVQLAGRLDGDVDDEIAAPVAVEVLDALAVQRDDLAGLGTGADVDIGGTVEALHRQGGSQRGGHHRDRHRAVQVVALPLEDGVRALDDLEEQVARRTAARADLALAGQLDVRAVLDAGRDPHLDRPPGPHPAVAVALRAGPDQHGAVPAAAGADPGHHDLADKGTGHLADFAATAADVAGLRVRARRRALT